MNWMEFSLIKSNRIKEVEGLSNSVLNLDILANIIYYDAHVLAYVFKNYPNPSSPFFSFDKL